MLFEFELHEAFVDGVKRRPEVDVDTASMNRSWVHLHTQKSLKSKPQSQHADCPT